MTELMYHCLIYMKPEPEETKEEIIQRVENILNGCGLDYQCYGTELIED